MHKNRQRTDGLLGGGAFFPPQTDGESQTVERATPPTPTTPSAPIDLLLERGGGGGWVGGGRLRIKRLKNG